MEKRTGDNMVAIKLKPIEDVDSFSEQKDSIFLPTPLSFGAVSLRHIISNECRLDASAYNMEAMNALSKVSHCNYGIVPLSDLYKNAFVGNRFKRIYTDNLADIPFFLPSDIEDVYPKATKHISAKTRADIDSLRVNNNMLLMSCSGTIGKTTLVGAKLEHQVFSHDLLRITFKNDYDLGYTYAFFNTEIGLTILRSNNYGAVIDHIEPEHLCNIPIPNAPKEVRKQIHELIVESYNLRNQSNELIDKSQDMMYTELHLPKMQQIEGKRYVEDTDLNNFSIKASNLDGRFDVSYHLPLVDEVIRQISLNSEEVTSLGDERISKDIILPGRFKRIYVDKEHGVPFFGGKQILSLNPSDVKYLSIIHHGDRIDNQLLLEENMCAVTCSGTIGKVMIIPKHWEGWTLNQHVMRIKPASKEIAGYIFAWLDSPYCKPLILRNVYGAVVDEIDDIQLSRVPIPLLKNKEAQKEINDHILEANSLRYQAYQKEHEAMTIMNDLLNSKRIIKQ